MQIEFNLKKLKVKIVAINDITATSDQQLLINKCSFPLFQDTDRVKAWNHHSGAKDDFYIYDAKGKLRYYMPAIGGSASLDLSTQEGYDNLKNAITKILQSN